MLRICNKCGVPKELVVENFRKLSDRIKPMATHVYSCESDPGFKDAWRLENLRPLRSKENIILGASMKRINNKTNKLIHEVV